MACTAGSETNEIPASDHECMHHSTYIAIHINLVCISQAHNNTSYITNNSNINNGKAYNRTTVRHT